MPLTSLGGDRGSGKGSWKLLCTNKKQKGLGRFQCVNIWGWGNSAPEGGRVSKV